MILFFFYNSLLVCPLTNSWRVYQPDNENNEDCVEIVQYYNDFRWNDADCQKTYGWVLALKKKG